MVDCESHNVHSSCYSVTGVDDALLCTEALNVLINLHNSLFAIVLTTAAGAHPPGFTVRIILLNNSY